MARGLMASTCLVIGLTLVAAGAQVPGTPNDQQYVFIDARSTRSKLTRSVNLSKVRDRLLDAAEKGFQVRFMAGFSSSANLLLNRGDVGPVGYRLVAASRENAFLNQLNELASQGFRVVPEGIKAFEESVTFGRDTTWMAVMAKHADAPRRIKYSVVKGTQEGERALADSATTGRALVGILGRQGLVGANTLLFFEESNDLTRVPSASGQPDYRIVATGRTSAMQKDLAEAAAEGFRIIGAGFGYMTVVMARERGSTPPPIEYRLIATTRVETGIKELQAAGGEGFRILAMSENAQEGVFVLQRAPGTADRFEYDVMTLDEATANKRLLDAEADGYRIVRLLSDLVLLERQRPARMCPDSV